MSWSLAAIYSSNFAFWGYIAYININNTKVLMPIVALVVLLLAFIASFFISETDQSQQ